MNGSIYFRHSGRVSAGSLLLLFVLAPVLAAVGGVLYGTAIHYCPLVYINVLLTCGFGFGLGWLVYQFGKVGRNRSVPVIATAGLLAGLVGEYAAFVGWAGALVGWRFIIPNPVSLAGFLSVVAEEGVWSLFGFNVHGAMLYTVWGIEGLIILGFPTLWPYRRLKATAYCEPCSRWAEDTLTVGPFNSVADLAAVRRSLEQGDFAILGSLSPLAEPAATFTAIDLIRCPHCDDLQLLTMRHVTLQESNGKVTENSTHVVQNLLIDRASRELIVELAAPVADEAPAVSEAAETPPAAAT